MLSFLALIITYYRSNEPRQGHYTGLVILPIKRGPVGYDGLKLSLNWIEKTIVGRMFSPNFRLANRSWYCSWMTTWTQEPPNNAPH